VKGLAQVARELETGALALDPALEDVHTNVERRLAEIAGPVAGKLHTGRSRNDQIATTSRSGCVSRLATCAARSRS